MKFNIKSKSFNSNILSSYMENLLLIFRMKPHVKISGIATLPTKIKKFTVNRSPHIDNKSRDQFEIRTYSMILMIIGDFNEVFSSLTKTITPQGVNVGINVSGNSSKNYIRTNGIN
ncbi:30S ribosomal protein S10 [Candidatus Hodgkinia cicadicola]|uniref:Small ribosomal subunit protein uS10 n=1 Tax=Candidatus Hodgkinia cicadicola TaxID=573658 RepID=A0ABX4MJX5_9HYPH|nr:30S ribosomal protein S10 [Candidatus Hodgkinia cicadicola]